MSSIPGERLTSDLCLIVCAFLEEMWVVNGLRPQDFRHSEFSFSESSAAESSIPKNLQQQFSFIGDNAVIAHLAEQLGHGCLGSDHFTLSHFSCKINVVSMVSHVSALRFGWSMLLVLSAPPSNVDILDFTDNGVKGFLFDIRRLYNRKFRFTTSQVQTDRKTQVQPFQIPGSSSHDRSQDSWLCKKACWP
jgi:hypothetical protein